MENEARESTGDEGGLRLDLLPVRKATLPFFYTPPLALVAAGLLLVLWGSLALSTPWATYTVALTHVLTLGFLTLSCLGFVYLLLGVLGVSPPAGLRITHFVYWFFLLGGLGLILGTARLNIPFVQWAISSVGLMTVVFLGHASRALRRASHRGATRQALALSLWGFLGVAFLGVWLAHGYGGMQFPGPRVLWTQTHALVGLLAWLGAIMLTLSSELWPTLFRGRPFAPLGLVWIRGLLRLGLIGTVGLLVLAYFFPPQGGAKTLAPWVVLFVAPMAVAVWGLHSWCGLRSLRDGIQSGGLLYWRTGLALGPWVLLSGGVAWSLGDPRSILLFGWLALYGWAGMLVCGALVGLVPRLLLISTPLEDRLNKAWLRLGFGLHLVALGAGSIGILSRHDDWVRLAGALMLLHGLELGGWLLRTLSATRPSVLECEGEA